MYHGSSNPRLKTLRPKKIGKTKQKGVFATPRRGLATFFSLKDAKWKNLTREEGNWEVVGLTEDQLSKKGYLYHLDPDDFEQYEGWQYISKEPVQIVDKEVIEDIGKELQSLGFKIKPKVKKSKSITRL